LAHQKSAPSGAAWHFAQFDAEENISFSWTAAYKDAIIKSLYSLYL
jgi:hypothetical protein